MTDIPVVVRSNEDSDQRVLWPNSFACRPMLGDNVASVDGKTVRKIVGITHCRPKGGDPQLNVEVHR